MENLLELSRSLPKNTLINTQRWFEASGRAGSFESVANFIGSYPNERLLSNIGFGDISSISSKAAWQQASRRAGSLYFNFHDSDFSPRPTAFTREYTEWFMDDFKMPLSHEHELFDHEAYGGVPDGIAPHVSDMAGLDRIIFEDCIESAGDIQATHLNLYDVKYYKRPETIAWKCNCEIDEARALLDSWAIIGDSEELIAKYILWTKDKGVESAIVYFTDLADELLAVEGESFSDCKQPELSMDHTTFESELFETFTNLSFPDHARRIMGKLSKADIRLMVVYQELADRLDAAYTERDFIEAEVQDAAPREYKYHPIGAREELDYYEDIAPDWVKGIIGAIERLDAPKAVAEMGKSLYKHRMGIHAGTIWMHYNQRKAELAPEDVPVSQKACEIIDFIEKCRTRFRLGKYGKRLYELQSECRIEGNLAIAEGDWSPIWDAYREKKEGFTAS